MTTETTSLSTGMGNPALAHYGQGIFMAILLPINDWSVLVTRHGIRAGASLGPVKWIQEADRWHLQRHRRNGR